MGHISRKKIKTNLIRPYSTGLHGKASPAIGQPNIVTAAILGLRATSADQNAERADLLDRIISQVIDIPDWTSLDALVLPGATFFLPHYVGHLSFEDRQAVIAASDVGLACQQASLRLSDYAPGALLIVGLDSISPGPGNFGDQMAVAWSGGSIIGIGRKVFPVDADSNGVDLEPVLCYAEDYATPHRIVRLRSGHNALLCSCYDAFGVAEHPDAPTARTRYIRDIVSDGTLHSQEHPGFAHLRQSCIRDWRNLIDSHKVSITIACVHSFARPGHDLFWQRHGIATAAAQLNGLAVGAAHFHDWLPDATEVSASTLASWQVPSAHLSQGLSRKANILSASAAIMVTGEEQGRALVRYISPPAPAHNSDRESAQQQGTSALPFALVQ